MPVLTRAVYKSVKKFAEQYDMKLSTAYAMVSQPDFPKIKIGDKAIRVNMSEVEGWMAKKFN